MKHSVPRGVRDGLFVDVGRSGNGCLRGCAGCRKRSNTCLARPRRCGSIRRCNPLDCGSLPIHPAQEEMPFGMSHTNRHDDVAPRYRRLISYGLALWSLLSRLQLAPLCRAFPARHDNRAMAIITLVILAEKTLPWPRSASYIAGVALVLYGALLIASPQLTMH